jgi:3-oxoacyl-[acyl-carrier protein] reductase
VLQLPVDGESAVGVRRSAHGNSTDVDATDLAGRTAVVTGASRGLGREIAGSLAGAGARVVAIARDRDGLAEAVEGMPGEVIALPVDLADVDGIAGAVSGIGDVDVLVNAAAVMSARRSKTLEVSLDAWRSVRAVDLDAPFALVSAFVPGMAERRWGRVVNVTACLGRMSGPGTAGGLAPYRVAKAGLNALTRNLAHELGMGRRGVLVDATCPGHCLTDMGGPDAPRSIAQGADTAVWLACRAATLSAPPPTGRLWEDRAEVPW